MDLARTLEVAINPAGAVAGGRTAEGAFRGVGRAAKGMEGSTRSAGSALSYLKTTLAAVGLGTFARELYQTSVTLDRLQGQMKAASGSTEEFRKNFAFLRGESEKFGLNLVSAGNAFNRFAQEARGKMATEQIKAVFNSVAEASAVLQLSGEQTTNVLNVMGQMMARGAVDSRQLKMQLQDIPQVLTMLADSYGVTEKQMLRMIDTGNVLGTEVVPRLAKRLHEVYGPDAVASAHGLEQEMNRLKNTWKEFQGAFMSSGGDSLFAKVIKEARGALDDLKMTMVALFQASSEGQLGEAIRASLIVGFGEAANYFGGFIKWAGNAMAKVGEALFSTDYFVTLLRAFQGVAAGFGIAFLKALQEPLTYVQATMENIFDWKNLMKNGELKAQATEMVKNDPKFSEGYKIFASKGEWFRTPQEQIKAEGALAQIGVVLRQLQADAGVKSFDSRRDAIRATGGPKFNLGYGEMSIDELEAANAASVVDSASKLIKQTSGIIDSIGTIEPANIIDVAPQKDFLKSLYGRSKNMFAGKPQASAGIAPEPPAKSWVKEMKDGITGAADALGTLEQRAYKVGYDAVGAMTSGFKGFFDSIIDGTESVASAFKKMAASILSDIAKIIAQRMVAEPLAAWAMNAISAMLPGPKLPAGTPVGDFSSSFGSSFASTAHTGGLIGSTALSGKLVDPSIFSYAPRLHSGLKPDEFPAILQRGEEVIPKGGRGGGAPIVFNNTVNVDGSRGGTPDQNQKLGAEITRQLQSMVQEQIVRAMMPRGVLSAARA